MTIPPRLVDKLQPLFDAIGFKLVSASVKDPYNQAKTRSYTAAIGKDVEVVVLHLPSWVLQTADAIAFLMQATTNIRDRHGRIISEGLDRAAIGYRMTLQSVSERETNFWMFVPWGDIEEAFSGQTPVKTVFAIPPTPPPLKDNEPTVGARALRLDVDRADLEAIVQIFITEAGLDKNFFPALVQLSDCPEPLKAQFSSGWTGNARDDAWHLLNVLVARNRYDFTHKHHGDTYLGWLLLGLLDSVGNPSDETLARIVIKYSLVNGEKDLQGAKARLPGGC